MLNRKPGQVAASEIEQIKGVKIGVIGTATTMFMLKFLKRGPSLVIERHNFAVEDELLGLELPQTFDHGGKSGGQVIRVARYKRHCSAAILVCVV